VRIGFVINNTHTDYGKGLVAGVDSYCREHGHTLMVYSARCLNWPYGYEYQNTAILRHIHEGNVDALVIATGTQCNFISPGEFREFLSSLSAIPMVSLAIPIDGVPSVVVDNDVGLRNLLEHIAERHGSERYAVLKGPDDNAEARQRLTVFQEFLSRHGLEFDPSIAFAGDFSAENSLLPLKMYVEANGVDFDCLVCLNDSMATSALAYFRDKGIRVPGDVIVTGFDDIMRSRYESPSLSTVSQDLEAQGRLAAEYAARLASGDRDVPALTTLNTSAVYRQSCGCVPAELEGYSEIRESGQKVPADAGFVLSVGQEWFRLQDDIVHLRQYLSHLISLLSLSDLVDDLRQSLESFNIRSAAIVLFRKEIHCSRNAKFSLPEEAQVILRYDEETTLADALKPVKFNPRARLLPEGTFSARARTLVANSLYHREEQLGYIVYEPGSCDPSIYETLCVQLSTTIRSALVFAEKEAAEERLNDALYDLEKSNKKLSDISRTDELTGLYNRRGFISLGQQSIDLAIRMNKGGLVVFSDMDGLKVINDTYGHDAGDRAIIAMGKALRKTFRNIDIVARLGGDEFSIVAIDVAEEFLDIFRRRLDQILEAYNATSGEPFKLSLSLGAVSFSHDDNNRLEKLLSLADSVLYEEKRLKRAARVARSEG
jgi:diguanylate cyclase (GGDEF)-like protein